MILHCNGKCMKERSDFLEALTYQFAVVVFEDE